MAAFKNIRTSNELIAYQKQVLSRTGGRTSKEARLFHYTNINAMRNMLATQSMWLSPAVDKNDILEAELIRSAGITDLCFSCFSRANQNIAMFKMYAPNPDGVMLSISFEDAKMMLNQRPVLVEDGVILEETDTVLYWIGVCYKDIESDKITTPGQENHHIEKPLKELAGAIKLSGWEYEKEVRICGIKRLNSGQKISVKLPEKVEVVLCPGFDREKNKRELSFLMQNGVGYKSSLYEDWIRL